MCPSSSSVSGGLLQNKIGSTNFTSFSDRVGSLARRGNATDKTRLGLRKTPDRVSQAVLVGKTKISQPGDS